MPETDTSTAPTQPLPTASTPSSNSSLLRKRNFPLTPLVILTVVVLLSVVAFGTYQLGKTQATLPETGSTKDKSSTVTEETKTSTVSSSLTNADLITNWKTYTNTQYKYAIKYPDNRYLDPQVPEAGRIMNEKEIEESTHVMMGGYDEEHFDINFITPEGSNNPKNLDIKELAYVNYVDNLEGHGAYESISVTEPTFFNLNGAQGYSFSIRSNGHSDLTGGYIGYKGIYRTIWAVKDKNIILITYTVSPLFDQILSTFRFADNAVGWKTYTHTRFAHFTGFKGFKLSYPKSWNLNINDGRNPQEEGVLLLSLTKGNAKINFVQAASDGSGCLYKGDPEVVGPYIRFARYAEIVSSYGKLLRRSLNEDSSKEGTYNYSICQESRPYYDGVTELGGISYEITTNKDLGLLSEMDTIIGNIVVQ